jgi:hypothetical protein
VSGEEGAERLSVSPREGDARAAENVRLAVGLSAIVGLVLAVLLTRADRYLASFGTTAAPEAALPILTVVLAAAVALVAVQTAAAALLAATVGAHPPAGAAPSLALQVAALVFALVGLGAVRLPYAGAAPFAPPLVTTAAGVLFLAGLAAFVARMRALSRWAVRVRREERASRMQLPPVPPVARQQAAPAEPALVARRNQPLFAGYEVKVEDAEGDGDGRGGGGVS